MNLISETEYQKFKLKICLTKFMVGDVKGFISNLIQSDLLNDSEYEGLKKLLE